MFWLWRSAGRVVQDVGSDLEETRGRAKWEPRGFYFFRRLLQYSAGGILVIPCVAIFLGILRGLMFPALGLALAGCVVGFVGMILTAPTSKKKRRGKPPTRHEAGPSVRRRL